jgi:hypothetical protein
MRSFAFSAIVSILIALIAPSTAAAQSSTSIGPEKLL